MIISALSSLGTILFLALAIRIGVLLLFPCAAFLFPDSREYHAIAMNILNGKGIILGPTAIAHRPPLYSLFLAASYYLGMNIFATCVLQCFIGTLCVYLQYNLALQFFKRQDCAKLAALLLAVDPFHIACCAFLLTETIFTLLLLATITLLYPLWQGKERPELAILAAGFFLGVGCLCRASLTLFVGVAIVLLYFGANAKRWRYIYLLILSCCLVILPWTTRNWMYFNRLVPVTTQSGDHLYEVLGPGATGGPRLPNVVYPPEIWGLSEIERDAYLRNWVFRYIQQHPQHLLQLMLVKLYRFWNLDFNHQAFQKHPSRWLIISFTAIVYLAVIATLLQYRHYYGTLLLLTPVLYFSGIHSIFMGSVRFRIPVMPYLEIIAAWSIMRLINFAIFGVGNGRKSK